MAKKDEELTLFKAVSRGLDIGRKLAVRSSKKLKNYTSLARPMTTKERFYLRRGEKELAKYEYNLVSKLVKQNKTRLKMKKTGWTFLISGDDLVPYFTGKNSKIISINDKIKKSFMNDKLDDFAERAWSTIPQYIASSKIGNLSIKRALTLQLVAKERIHILLFGDLDSAKLDFVKSTQQLASKSDFISGFLSKRNFTLRKVGNKIYLGVLPKCDSGLCCIDMLCTISEEDAAYLKHAMSKGFISYGRSKAEKLYNTRVNVLAAANPAEGKFDYVSLNSLKTQIAVPPGLLSRFHIKFFLKDVELGSFRDITEKIISAEKGDIKKADIVFIKNYLKKAKELDVQIPRNLVDRIKNFILRLKEKEKKVPYEVSEDVVAGVINMVKSSARLELRDLVETKDLERVFSIFYDSFKI
jgi:DNA replicative helicase MCM subunit Mcm2 (Cdc46/Mcm family)